MLTGTPLIWPSEDFLLAVMHFQSNRGALASLLTWILQLPPLLAWILPHYTRWLGSQSVTPTKVPLWFRYAFHPMHTAKTSVSIIYDCFNVDTIYSLWTVCLTKVPFTLGWVVRWLFLSVFYHRNCVGIRKRVNTASNAPLQTAQCERSLTDSIVPTGFYIRMASGHINTHRHHHKSMYCLRM